MDNKEEIKKLIDSRVKELMPAYLESNAFTQRKLTDTPTDNLQVVPRKYVTLNGNTANRPKASVIGQFYLDTQIGKPVWWIGNRFVDGQGTTV